MNAATILIVEDDFALREALSDTLELSGYQTVLAENGKSAISVMEKKPVDMVISDVQMPVMDGHSLLKRVKERYPDIPVLLMTAFGTISKAIQAIQEGAVDYLVKPFEPDTLLKVLKPYIQIQKKRHTNMIATASSMQNVLQMAERIAQSDATVMITGASGTGKEVLARYIHQHSLRADGAFVAINCAAIPENMLEATLFGYEKGAFTGAQKALPGKFEQAQGGTLLLDEISEMDLALQAKLLRVLQEKEVERLGSQHTIKLDVRILATSNRHLQKEIQAGHFREDLFYRLNVLPLHLPLLRDRKEDIIPLAEYFLAKMTQAGQKMLVLDKSAKNKLVQYSWPGNVRELDNTIQRAVVLANGASINAKAILFEQNYTISEPFENIGTDYALNPNEVGGNAINLTKDPLSTLPETLEDDLKGRERQLILKILEENAGNRSIAAQKLGISQRTLRYKIAQMRDAGMVIPKVSRATTG